MTAWIWFWGITVFGALLLTAGVSAATIIGGFSEIRRMFRYQSDNGSS